MCGRGQAVCLPQVARASNLTRTTASFAVMIFITFLDESHFSFQTMVNVAISFSQASTKLYWSPGLLYNKSWRTNATIEEDMHSVHALNRCSGLNPHGHCIAAHCYSLASSKLEWFTCRCFWKSQIFLSFFPLSTVEILFVKIHKLLFFGKNFMNQTGDL